MSNFWKFESTAYGVSTNVATLALLALGVALIVRR